MVTLPLNATDEAILATLQRWLIHLSNNEYEEAFDLTYHFDRNDPSPDRLREQIAFYGDQFNKAVQLPEASEYQPKHCVMRPNPKGPAVKKLSSGRLIGSYESLVTAQSEADPSFLGEVVLQLPFGGKWSDVFATFEMFNRNGRLVFFLKSIYIH